MRASRFASLLLLLTAGCGGPLTSGTTLSLTGDDVQRMAGQMVTSITGDTEVQEVLNRPGPMDVVVLPVRNRLTGEVLPPGQAYLFTAKLRNELGRVRPDAFRWVANRDDYYRLRASELAVPPGPSPDAVQPEYALQATFRSLVSDDKRRRETYYLCEFELTDLADRETLWTDAYEVEKQARRGFLD